jgi:hypothetical protein
MATTYSALKTEIADFVNRSDLTSIVDTFIDQAEAEMQVRCKEIEFETRSTVTVTAGVATLPTGWLSARSMIWNGDTARRLSYVPPDKLEMVNASSPAFVNYYTIVGAQLRFADDGDGSVIATYNAKFTPLSDSNTSNSILAEFPSAYLYGSLKHAAVYLKDFEAARNYEALFDQQMALVIANNAERKYAGAALQVRPA